MAADDSVFYDEGTNAFVGDGDRILAQVMWHVTDRCPLACPYCFATKSELDTPSEVFEATVQALAALGVQKIDIGGGEPLVFRQLPELLEVIESAGIATTLTTSGVGSPSVSNWVVQNAHRFARVILSLDGPSADHDRLRGRAGTYDALLALAQDLQAAGYRRVRVNTVGVRSFLDVTYLSATIEDVRRIDPEEWCLIQPHPANEKAAYRLHSTPDDSFEAICREASEASKLERWVFLQRSIRDYTGYWVLYPGGILRPHTDGPEDGHGVALLESSSEAVLDMVQEVAVPLPRPVASQRRGRND